MGNFISLLRAICYVMFSLLCNGGLTYSRIQNQSSSCATSCGHLHDIRQPFRLKTDPPHCGSTTSFEITCDSEKPYYEWIFGKFYIKNISYFYQTITVMDPAYIDSTSCRLPSYPIEEYAYEYLDSTLDRAIRTCSSSQLADTASFISCTEQIQNPNYISCMSGNGSFMYVLIGTLSSYNLEPSCTYVNMTLAPDNLEPGTTIQALDLLQEGVQLCWYRKSLSMLLGRCLKSSLRYFSGRIKNNQEKGGQLLVQNQHFYWGLDILSWYGQDIELPFISPLVDSELLFLQCMGENVDELRALRFINEETAVAVVDRIKVILIVLQIFLLIIVLVLLGRVICMPLVLFVFLAHKYLRTRMPFDNMEMLLRHQQALATRRFSHAELISITRNFREKLGEGGFGSVFKGTILSTKHVAVKILGSSQLHGEEFINEVSTLCNVHHRNIVQLIGYCSDRSMRALVYEYMPNGSLDKHIFSTIETCKNSRSFSWEKLKEIALGVARGIDYLHRECDMQIIHFDIKPHNILLDQNFVPKVSDFGLAKLYPKDFSLVSVSIAKGTAGYIAPELLSRNFGPVSDRSDVYSFGMLLLEMAGGRRNRNPEVNSTNKEYYYPSWIYDQLVKYREKKINKEIEKVEEQLCTIGLWCIQIKPSDRPSMTEVVEMLARNGLDNLPLPPKPFFACSRPDSL